MKTNDLFVSKKRAQRINESLAKTFGKKLNLENFDLHQLYDARNKLRTQLSQVRTSSGFNETVENSAYLEAQWMLDAITAEIQQRGDIALESELQAPVEPEEPPKREYAIDKPLETDKYGKLHFINSGGAHMIVSYQPNGTKIIHKLGRFEELMPIWKKIKDQLASHKASQQPSKYVESIVRSVIGVIENAQPNWEYLESVPLMEGEVQQASAIVTAKTMADRVSRWIEELSGMENDTLLQLGDAIRDEMGLEQARRFIETVVPAIQTSLENLKQARETIATGVRVLTGEEQPAEMMGSTKRTGSATPAGELGAEPAAGGRVDEIEPMTVGPDEPKEDDFAVAEPAAGGAESAGREQRESIDFQGSLLKILAG